MNFDEFPLSMAWYGVVCYVLYARHTTHMKFSQKSKWKEKKHTELSGANEQKCGKTWGTGEQLKWNEHEWKSYWFYWV